MRPYLLFAVSVAFYTVLLSSPRVALTDTASPGETSNAARIVGSIVDTEGGLPVPDASIQITCRGAEPRYTITAPDGSFSVTGVSAGVCSVLITARGYQTTRSASLSVAAGERVELRIALTRSSAALRSIGRIVVSSTSTLQTSSTINAHVEPNVLQSQNYMRAGDALISVPGLNTQTSSSVGDDLNVSVRGFDATETATLLDGHPIGPIGAQGSAFNYQDSPFFGLRDIETVFGSGATGIYGAPTIAGSVDFLTISPTQEPHALLEEGIGGNGKTLTGVQATGPAGKLGYAFSHAVEGTYGYFPTQNETQYGLLGTDIRAATVAANTYQVSGNYSLRNDLGKLTYAFSPRTSVLVSLYAASSWNDKTGNGDNDFITYPYNLYNTLTALAANGGTSSVTLPNGTTAMCTGNTQAVLSDASAGYSCLQPTVYAAKTSGPAGGGTGDWQALRHHDYHARLTQTLGRGQISVDGFIDHYVLDNNHMPAQQTLFSDFYRTAGFLIADELTGSIHDLTFGYYHQHQQHTGDVFPFIDQFGNSTNILAAAQEFDLTQASVFARDQYTPSSKLSIFANFWLEHSANTRVNSFDPRVAFMYRPTSNQILRLAAGRSNSEPDPSLLYAFPSYTSFPQVITPLCGGQQNQIGSVSNPKLVPETATDEEFAYGHRLGAQDNIQIDVYDTYEHNALFGANLPLSALGQTQVPTSIIDAFLARIHDICKTNPTISNLAVGTTYNAAAARYRGIEISGLFHPLRNVTAKADYDVQSAVYLGVPDSILAQNILIINGSQNAGIPLHKASLGLEYVTRNGLAVNLDSHYIGDNNTYNRPAFSFVNGSLSQQVRHATFTLGVNNIFNSAAQTFGYFGFGTFRAENQFGTDQNAFQQASERFGLPPSQYFFTMSYQV